MNELLEQSKVTTGPTIHYNPNNGSSDSETTQNNGNVSIPPMLINEHLSVKWNNNGQVVEDDEYGEIGLYMNTGDIVLNRIKVAENIIKKRNVISFNDLLYTYQDGIFPIKNDKPIGKTTIEQDITIIAKRAKFKSSIASLCTEILHIIKTTNPIILYPFNNNKNLIPVENGVLDINFDTGKITLKEHSPEYKFTFKLPIKYDPNVSAEYIESIFKQWVGPESLNVLYQIPAQALLQSMGFKPYKKSYILVGNPDAGKTTYIELNEAFFGHDNISGVSLHQICHDTYAPANMEGKILNMCDELSNIELKDGNTFKRFVGGYYHTIRKMYQQPYKALVFAVHVFACNEPPTISKDIMRDSAFWTRWEYVIFPNSFEKDTHFNQKMLTDENMSGLLNIVIQKMIEINKNGLLIDSDTDETCRRWIIDSSPLAEFITENMDTTGTTYGFRKKDLRTAYDQYCIDKMIKQEQLIKTEKAFTNAIMKYGFNPGKMYPRNKDEGKSQINVFKTNYNFKEDSSYRVDSVNDNHATGVWANATKKQST